MKLDDDLDPPEREVTLGTATILGIFLALALVCAAFFGFGYSMGRHSTSPAIAATAEPKTDAKSETSDSKAAAENTSSDDSADTDTSAATPAARISSSENAATKPAAPQPEEKVVVQQDAPKASAPTPHPVAFPVPATPALPAAGGGSIMVQVSATSRQGDAEALIGALRQKGYTAAIHHLPDNLYHVQLGPFASRKDAEAMRQRLGTSGYNAIIK